MKKLLSLLSAVLIMTLFQLNAFAYSNSVQIPFTGETSEYIYILIGLMAAALIAIIAVIIIRLRKKNNGDGNDE